MRAAPPNLFLKKAHRKWPFSHPKHEENGPKKKLWLDIYVEKGFWAKESAQLVIPVRSTFQNDLHPPIGGHHPVLYFTTHVKKKYCTAMCYSTPGKNTHINTLEHKTPITHGDVLISRRQITAEKNRQIHYSAPLTKCTALRVGSASAEIGCGFYFSCFPCWPTVSHSVTMFM